jgi:hypothetical protein
MSHSTLTTLGSLRVWVPKEQIVAGEGPDAAAAAARETRLSNERGRMPISPSRVLPL